MQTKKNGIWTYYNVEWSFRDRLMGGIPKHPDVIESWLQARMPSEAEFERRKASGEEMTPIYELAEKVMEEVDATDEKIAKMWCGFMSDVDNGLYVKSSDAKSHIKDCSNVLKDMVKIKAFRSKVADRLYLVEQRIYLGKNEPDGFFEHPVHIMTASGPRSALKRNDYVEQINIAFMLKVLNDGFITKRLLDVIFEYGSDHGFGAERGLGNGKYDLVKFEEIEKA